MYPLHGGDIILRVDGQTRESACEILFEQDNDRMSVPAMILGMNVFNKLGPEGLIPLPINMTTVTVLCN